MSTLTLKEFNQQVMDAAHRLILTSDWQVFMLWVKKAYDVEKTGPPTEGANSDSGFLYNLGVADGKRAVYWELLGMELQILAKYGRNPDGGRDVGSNYASSGLDGGHESGGSGPRSPIRPRQPSQSVRVALPAKQTQFRNPKGPQG